MVMLTAVHQVEFYLAVLFITALLSGKEFFRLMKRSVSAVLLFSTAVNLSYLAVHGLDWHYLLLLNLRVIDMTFLTLLFISKVNLFRLLGFSKSLTYLLVVSYSQILLFRKYYGELTMALKSRSIKKPTLKERINFLRSATGFFIRKSVENSQEISLAMKSRGFFLT